MKSLNIKLLLLLIGAVACARGSAQNLRLENADGVFSLGDTVRVWATAMDGSDSLVFRKCFNSPTAKSLGDIGFIVAPEEFRPGFEEPQDFRSWWDSEISRMRGLPLEARLEEVLSKDPGVRTFSIEIPMHEGNPVRGYIGIPKDATPGAIQKEIHFFPYRGHTNWTCNSKDEWDRTVLRERIRFIEDYLR